MAVSALETIIVRAEARIKTLARAHCAKANVFHFGAVDIHPSNLAIWITAPRDRERDRLRAVPGLEESFRATLAAEGYPLDAVPLVHFAYESQETVDRDFNGNWWHAVK